MTGIRVISQVLDKGMVVSEQTNFYSKKNGSYHLTEKGKCKLSFSKSCRNCDADGCCDFANECSFETNFLYEPTEEAAKKILEHYGSSAV